MSPYEEGRNVDRNQPHRNPYPPGSVQWNQWEDGYEDGDNRGEDEELDNSPWWDDRYD